MNRTFDSDYSDDDESSPQALASTVVVTPSDSRKQGVVSPAPIELQDVGSKAVGGVDDASDSEDGKLRYDVG